MPRRVMNTRVDVTSIRSVSGISILLFKKLVFCGVDLITALDDEDVPLKCLKEGGELQSPCNHLIVGDTSKRPWET